MGSIRQSPLYKGTKGLFDTEHSTIKLSDDRASQFFLSKYMEIADPIERYPKYFTGLYGSVDFIYRFIKLYYKKYVITKELTESQYVMVLDFIFESRIRMSDKTMDMAKDRVLNPKKKTSTNRRRRL